MPLQKANARERYPDRAYRYCGEPSFNGIKKRLLSEPRYGTLVAAAATAAAVVVVVRAAAAVAAAAEQDEQDNDYPEATVISVVAEHSFDLSPH